MKRKGCDTRPLFPELEPPVVLPVWPNAGTRAYEVLMGLIEAPRTQKQWLDLTGDWRLSAGVKALKYKGWAILSIPVLVDSCRSYIAQYRLDRKDPGVAKALQIRKRRK